MNDALAISGLRKHYGRIPAIADISLRVPQRCVYGLIGPNGAGKTTLFSLICGFLRPDAGTIHVGGVDVLRDGLPLGKVGVLPQDALFQRNVPILHQLTFFMRLKGHTQAYAVSEVMATLERVGLKEMSTRRVGSLSHGMAKRMALAQAFLDRPDLILLDEPTAGLDPEQTAVVCALIVELKQSSTVVVSSHNLDQLQAICDEIGVIDKGRVVASGPLNSFLGSGRQMSITVNRPLPPATLAGISGTPGVASASASAGDQATVKIVLTAAADIDASMTMILRLLLDAGVVPRRIESSQNLESEVLAVLKHGASASTLQAASGKPTAPANR